MRKILVTSALALGLAASLSACSNPYDPGQRALGGGALGAGAGAALGGIAGGGRGALTGAVLGGAVGAIGGAATTPQAPVQRYEPEYQPRYQQQYQPAPSGPYRY